MTDKNQFEIKIQNSVNKVKLERLMRVCCEVRDELKSLHLDRLYRRLDVACVLASQLNENHEVAKEEGIEISALARLFNVNTIEVRKAFRILGVFDKHNFPAREYEKWFVIERRVYFSENGNRCVVKKVYVKKSKMKYVVRFLKKNTEGVKKCIKL
nr:MAG TPA: hypothetical protein [Caudoviricetes sp.]